MIKKLKPALLISLIITILSILIILEFIVVAIDGRVVLVANLLLTAMLIWNTWRHVQATNNTNPHVMVRGVMGGVVLKLFVLGGAAFIYLYSARESINTKALFISMGLYIIYTWLEVRSVMHTKKSVDA